MHWSLLFVLGGGFAIAAGSTDSGLSKMLGDSLSGLKRFDAFVILFIVCLFAECITELTANVAVANIILPVLAEMVSSYFYLLMSFLFFLFITYCFLYFRAELFIFIHCT